MREEISDELRARVLNRDDFMCRYCGASVHRFDIDHVYPVVKGGETTMENLVTACPRCNRSKNGKVGIWPKPIGYFDDKRPDIFIAFLCAIGFLVTIVGSILYFWDATNGFYTVLVGACVEFIGLVLKRS